MIGGLRPANGISTEYGNCALSARAVFYPTHSLSDSLRAGRGMSYASRKTDPLLLSGSEIGRRVPVFKQLELRVGHRHRAQQALLQTQPDQRLQRTLRP